MLARRLGPLIAGLVAVSAMLPARAEAEDAEVAKTMAEITKLSAEQRQVPAKLEQSLALKRQHEQQFKQLKQEGVGLKSESAAIEAQRPSVRRVCTGTYPPSQMAAAKARCHAAQAPFNRRVDAHNAKKRKLSARHEAVRQRETARVAAAKRLSSRNAEITRRIAALRAAIRARQMALKPKNCAERCKAMASGDAAAQCLQGCFDGARGSGSLPTVEQKQRPAFSMTPNRTPQQAIDEYKKSGEANPLPKSFRRNSAEPPPPPPGK